MSTLSLCLIARNEEMMLPGLLQSVAGVVDRIVLVDTGSTDRTVEIAREAGATVLFFNWIDDFAAARNAALGAVNEGWILQLDADERLAPGVGDLLRQAIESETTDGYLLPIHNASRLDATPSEILSGAARIDAALRVLRLLRWTEDLRWEGRIHESPRAWASRHRIRTLDAPLLHLGYAPDYQALIRKNDRNLKLLEVRCQETADDLEGWTYLAFEYYRANRLTDGARAVRIAWGLLQASLARKETPPLMRTLGSMYVQLLLKKGQVEEAQKSLEALPPAVRQHPNLRWLSAEIHRTMGRLEEAEVAYRQVLQADVEVLSEPMIGGAIQSSRAGLAEVQALRAVMQDENPLRISLCMIVKNEEGMLPGLLASVSGQVDQIVLVDTGSTDRTVEIAKAAGALVLHHVWNDHFAEARNVALRIVKHGWILMLDADERLAPGAGALLRRAVLRPDVDAWMLPLYNATRIDATTEQILSGEARKEAVVYLPRLFRRTADFCWERRVHESPQRWMLSRRDRVDTLQLPILHLGYVQQIRMSREKVARNLRLLHLRCAESPEDPTGYSYLALECFSQKELSPELRKTGEQALEEGWNALLQLLNDGQPCPPISVLVTLRIQRLLERNDLAGAEDCLHLARRHAQPHPNLDWIEGWVGLHAAARGNRDALRSAETAFRRALAFQGKPVSESILSGSTSWGAQDGLGHLLLLAGRPQEAEACFRAVLQEYPDHPSAQLGAWEARIDRGEAMTVIQEIQPRLVAALSAGDPAKAEPRDLWALATLACQKLGLVGETEEFLQRALKEGSWRSFRRMIRIHSLQAERSFWKGAPLRGPGHWGTIGALLLRKKPEWSVKPDAETVDQAVGLLVERGEEAAIGILLEAALVRDEVLAALERRGLQWE